MKLSQRGPHSVVLLIDDLFEWTGTEVHLLRLLTQLDPARFQCVVGVVGRAQLAAEFRAQGINVTPLEIYRVFSPAGLVGIGKVVRLLRKHNAQLLVTYHTAADLLGPMAGSLLGIPVLSCRRDDGFTKKPIHLKAQRPLNRLVRGMITVSHAVAKAVERNEGYPRERMQVIWNGEDLERFAPCGSLATRAELRKRLGVPDEACIVLSAGLLAPVKDYTTQLDALARLAPQHPEAWLLIAGDGPERARLETQARNLPRVRLLGHRHDLPTLLQASDIYLQTSLTEGFSNAILQAMAAGLPVVVTHVGGNPELVTAESGMLIPSADPAAAARTLSRLIANTSLRQAMGRAARLRAERHFSREVMVEAYMDAFARAIAGCFPGRCSGCERPTEDHGSSGCERPI